jgi:hypothetical protein
MSAAFGWFLLLVLASRVLLIARDAPLSPRQAALLALVQTAALLPLAPALSLLPLAAAILAANLGGAWLERRDPARIGLYRLGALLLILLTAGFSFAPDHALVLRPQLIAAGAWLAEHLLYAGWLQAHAGGRTLPVLIGALLVVGEANILVRLILQATGVTPRRREPEPPADPPQTPAGLILPASPAGLPASLDRREYNAGRFIGVLERLLVYVVVLQGQYMAIGLILAAKGFARFKELDERDFAEYVLIGTLLSVTSAVAAGEMVKLLLPQAL